MRIRNKMPYSMFFPYATTTRRGADIKSGETSMDLPLAKLLLPHLVSDIRRGIVALVMNSDERKLAATMLTTADALAFGLIRDDSVVTPATAPTPAPAPASPNDDGVTERLQKLANRSGLELVLEPDTEIALPQQDIDAKPVPPLPASSAVVDEPEVGIAKPKMGAVELSIRNRLGGVPSLQGKYDVLKEIITETSGESVVIAEAIIAELKSEFGFVPKPEGERVLAKTVTELVLPQSPTQQLAQAEPSSAPEAAVIAESYTGGHWRLRINLEAELTKRRIWFEVDRPLPKLRQLLVENDKTKTG